MNNLIILVLLFGCAGTVVSKFQKERGYSKQDINMIEPHAKKYIRMLSHGNAFSNAFNSQPYQDSKNSVMNVYCHCVKKLESKCSQKPDGLNNKEKRIWAKGNGAEMAMQSTGTDYEAEMCP